VTVAVLATRGDEKVIPHFRLARPVTDLLRTEAMYLSGLGLTRLGQFLDHRGFDGVMLGIPGAGFHFEFTYCKTHPVPPSPTAEDLLIFYVPDQDEWTQRCEAVRKAGFVEMQSLNPYWDRNGRTFQDPDGYRIVIQCASWTGVPGPPDPMG